MSQGDYRGNLDQRTVLDGTETIKVEFGRSLFDVPRSNFFDIQSGESIDLQSGADMTFAAGGTTAYPVMCSSVRFTEAGDTTYTGTVEIPAGSFLLDIQFVSTVLWDDGTSAALDIGDDDDPNGWFAAVSTKATDLAVGEVLSITNSENWGGKQGVYLVAATGRKGRTTAGVDSGVYYGAASEVIGVITTGGQDGTAGRSLMNVIYCTPTLVAATAA